MSCNVTLPLSDIIQRVLDNINMEAKLDSDSGVANDLTLRGTVTLDRTAKASLCSTLADCVGDTLQSFTLQGDSLQLTTADGGVFNVDLSGFMTDADGKRLADQLRATLKDDYLATSELRGNQLRLIMKSGLVRKVDLSEFARDSTIDNMTMQGNNLVITLTDGTTKTINLSQFANPAPVLPTTNGGIKGDGTANSPIRLNLGNGLMVGQDGKLTLNLGEGLKVERGRLVIDDDGICTQVTKVVNNYTVLPTDEILTSSGGTITFPASIPVGKSYTVIQTGDSEVKLVGHPNIHSVGGTTTLKGKNHAVTVIRGTSSDWFVYGGVRP